ncbi:protein Per1p [Monosporozyma servazzii]
MKLLNVLSSLSLFIAFCMGSPGDNLDEFIDCTYACEYQRNCYGSEVNYIDPETNAFSKVQFFDTPVVYADFLLWDCIADCDYQCQQIITKMRIREDKEIYQFHGKWPFLRLFGTQELYSVLFSIGNFIPHYQGFHRLKAKFVSPKSSPFNNILINYTYVAIAGMAAWTASSIFHLRDLIVTEKLDYFFAGLTVLSAFHALFARMTRLYLYKTLSTIFTGSVVFIFVIHLLRLYIDWSYTYNMRFNVFFGILQYGLLMFLSYQNYQSLKDHKNIYHYRTKLIKLCVIPVVLVVVTAMAMSLELFDFFSYQFQIDAHALWHAATIIPSHYLYEFLIEDFDYIAEAKQSRD